MSNPIESLVELYEESVKKADEVGLAKVYKQATDKAFECLKNFLELYHDFNITIEDVEYLDGYFIFGTGTNSVVHFHIKETPSWKYGIWWEPVETKESTEENPMYETNRLRCRIFTQYEEEIDKFKPSASVFVEECDFFLGDTPNYDIWDFAKDIKFIHDEPYLAFYREVHYTNFNHKHITRAKAKSFYEKYFKQKKAAEACVQQNDREMLYTIYTILKEDIDEGNCFIADRGDNWYPRYELIAKNTFDTEDGCYGLFDLLDGTDAEEAEKLWRTKEQECRTRSDETYGSWWYECCHDSITLLSADKFEKAFTECNKVDVNKLIEEM